MGLDDITRGAWCVIFQEFNGAEFDEHSMQFREPKR